MASYTGAKCKLDEMELILDVVTHWNSISAMLEHALKLQKVSACVACGKGQSVNPQSPKPAFCPKGLDTLVNDPTSQVLKVRDICQ